MKCREILSAGRLACTLVVTKTAAQEAARSLFSRLTFIEADDVAISGAFCGFSATVTVNGEQRPLAESFDLVIDLRPEPLFAGRRLPIGYYAPGANPEDIDQVLAELPEMRGRFKKPHFTAFVESRCFHGRSRTLDCRRCVDVCQFGAIRSENGKISVNHYLCQGCGGCVLVCPADAMEQVHPPREELLNILQRRLSLSDESAAFPTTLVISDGGTAAAEELSHQKRTGDNRIVSVEVEEIGHVGLETILFALSHGANDVVVASGSENPQGVTDAVAWQAEMARAILKGLDIEEDKCRFVVTAAESPPDEEASRTESIEEQMQVTSSPDREYSAGQERRALIRLAAQHLFHTSRTLRTWLPLPVGSPFGAVTVDSGACTLCMACVAACPSGALAAGGDVPRLLFVESRCHQCGLCGETCPERAVQLIPRMMCDAEQIETQVVLCETEVSRCLKCNAPFASRQMVNRMTEKLKSHWMYANERQLQRLKMCRVCRTRDALASEDMRLWNR
ncbi:MAG: ATP-binding protein, partial [Syntrophales bacterium]